MKVSILLPSYNHEKFVGAAIDSVLSQSYSDFELLVGDDGSTDHTAEVIRKYSDPRIVFFPHQSNLGATLNHRFLLEKAKGEYVALINSDDLWLPDKLEKQVQYLDDHPAAVMCAGWAKFIDENGNDIDIGDNIFEQRNRTQAEWIEYFFIHGNCICHPSVLVRREVYEKLGFYNLALRQLPDFEMWVRMIQEGEFYIFQQPMVAHRRFMCEGENTSSPTLNNSIRDVMESYYILSNYLENLSDQLFYKAFHDYFKNKNAKTHVELCCERFFLLESGKYYMGRINKQAAIMYLLKNYGPEMAHVLRETYDYSLQDFHALSCQVDLLGIRHAVEDTDKVDILGKEHIAEEYIRSNRLKSVGIALFGKNTFIYRIGKKILHFLKRG